jgi:diphosphomevalonate decarboxylase
VIIEATALVIEATAPSNIALIKYMGKEDASSNVPSNSSLSWTLDDLRTYVRVTLREDLHKDQWQPLKDNRVENLALSSASIQRYMKHFQMLKNQWGMQKNFLIESANNFPSDCGLASSASSFAALTKAAVEMFQELSPRPDVGIIETAELAKKGSGSSCRSFFGPWALWYKDGVRPLEFPHSALLHQVVVVEAEKKNVSSSEAHLRVTSSSLFPGRVERAERRLAELIHALKQENWRSIFDITWAEFWDMHSLFETSVPSFGYLQSASVKVLDFSKEIWLENKDGPVVTMDAGANVHFLWRQDQAHLAKKISLILGPKYRIISSQELREPS